MVIRSETGVINRTEFTEFYKLVNNFSRNAAVCFVYLIREKHINLTEDFIGEGNKKTVAEMWFRINFYLHNKLHLSEIFLLPSSEDSSIEASSPNIDSVDKN